MIPELIVFLALGQHVAKPCSGGAPPKNDPDCNPVSLSNITSGHVIDLQSGLQSHEAITRDGHYVYTIDDADNIYRCQVVSVVDPHNPFQEAPAFMIACYKQHEVEKEK